ncbi:MAG TPA: decaprenyl-phosphate phosphoribosyltransferase [Streptosporangiaceae bacterium]|nr:decaprenyl-phosphate phosphoribosyltransferase [Streptosporangiaceae bacterium]
MTTTPPAARQQQPATPARRLRAVIQSVRPKQWPKNLLVLAAPLAAGMFTRLAGFWHASLAVAAFIAASSAVYLVNDVLDVDRDKRHPRKRHRPIAAGLLPKNIAISIAGVLALGSAVAGLATGTPWLAVIIVAYLAISFSYSAGLKHVPVVELAAVASGFLLRVLGGAAATHVRPSGWFLLVCGLGALTVAIAKRRIEMTGLGPDAAAHRPATRHYGIGFLPHAQRAASTAMVLCYLLWAGGEPHAAERPWRLASAAALTLALVGFDRLAADRTTKPVEDLLARDRVMISCELAWLGLFAAGLYSAAR